METIGTGHWIFAGLFALLFFGYFVWGYPVDRSTHQMDHRGAYRYLLSIFVLLMVIYIFKRLL